MANPRERTRTEVVIVETGIGLLGLWLFFLYVGILWSVIGTLTSFQFKQDVKTIEIAGTSGRKYTPALVTSVYEKIRRNQDSRQEFISIIADIDSKVGIFKASRYKSESARIELGDEIRQLKGDKLIPDRAEETITEIEAQITDSKNKINQLRREESNQTDEIVQLERQKGELERKISGLEDADSKILLEHKKIEDILTVLKQLSSLSFGIFTRMPISLLTLVLTIAMGALGSLIYVTKNYFMRSKDEPFSWYFFRPFLGVGTALAIFVLAKAGILMIGGASLTADSVNPFFISFLAIISGLLSEQASDKIAEVGKNYFKIRVGIPRWAFKLGDEMKNKNKTLADLTQLIGVTDKEAQGWIDEDSSVPNDEQKIIAAWLNVPVREVFSDQKKNK